MGIMNNILLIEDDMSINKILAYELRKKGYLVDSLYDALYDMLGVEQTEKLMEKGVIEIAPLAYMRGRTLEDAYVILDEAQNTTDNQMKMFLTRLGFRSKMIVTGDISQIDLPRNTTSGLIRALDILEGSSHAMKRLVCLAPTNSLKVN